MATGLPWEYFGRQDDEIVATYLAILQELHGRKRRPAETVTGKGPQMSG